MMGKDGDIMKSIGEVMGDDGERHPPCCQLGKDLIFWKEQSFLCGPEHRGWVIALYAPDDAFYENINYCPFCGRRLYLKISRKENDGMEKDNSGRT